jgi:hypothetical protein
MSTASEWFSGVERVADRLFAGQEAVLHVMG